MNGNGQGKSMRRVVAGVCLAMLLVAAFLPRNTAGCDGGDDCDTWLFLCLFGWQPWACSFYSAYCQGGGGDPGGGGGGGPCGVTISVWETTLEVGQATQLGYSGCQSGSVTFGDDCNIGHVSGDVFYADAEGSCPVYVRCQYSGGSTCYDYATINIIAPCSISAWASPSEIVAGQSASLYCSSCDGSLSWDVVSGSGNVSGNTFYSDQPGSATVRATCYRWSGTSCSAETYITVNAPPSNCPCATPLSDSEWNAIANPPEAPWYYPFPNLQRDHTCQLETPTNPNYNCLAYTMGVNYRIMFEEPDTDPRDGKLSVAEMNAWYYNHDLTGIWYYGISPSDLTHFAFKEDGNGPDCRARSKMGENALIAHDASELEGGAWGNIQGGN